MSNDLGMHIVTASASPLFSKCNREKYWLRRLTDVPRENICIQTCGSTVPWMQCTFHYNVTPIMSDLLEISAQKAHTPSHYGFQIIRPKSLLPWLMICTSTVPQFNRSCGYAVDEQQKDFGSRHARNGRATQGIADTPWRSGESGDLPSTMQLVSPMERFFSTSSGNTYHVIIPIRPELTLHARKSCQHTRKSESTLRCSFPLAL